MKIFRRHLKSKKGFTMIELVIYAVLLVLVSGAVIGFFLQTVDVAETSRRSRESLDNAKRVLDVINQEVRHSSSVYTPTSVEGVHPGQIALETERDLPNDEESTYVDFYVDDDGVYIKREGQSEELITSEKVRVSNLVFTILEDANQRQMVRIQITVEYIDPESGSGTSDSVSLESTMATRAY